jgi:hypothetical protein
MTRPRIGLALGSGGARGWLHIGIIGSLIEAGIEPKEGAVAKGTLGSTPSCAGVTAGLSAKS